METSRGNNNNISTVNQTLIKVHRNKTLPSFNDNKFQLIVPVQWYPREIERDRAEISIIRKFCGCMRFCFMVILIFVNVHIKLRSFQ